MPRWKSCRTLDVPLRTPVVLIRPGGVAGTNWMNEICWNGRHGWQAPNNRSKLARVWVAERTASTAGTRMAGRHQAGWFPSLTAISFKTARRRDLARAAQLAG